MTITAGLDMTMIIVTGCTGQPGVDTGIILQLLILDGMTGKTGAGNFFGKLNFQWGMRISMAGKATANGKMIFTAMTGAAGRHHIKIKRRMALVTIQAKLSVGLTPDF